MADNPNEAKQQHHANLAAEHQRLAQYHESHSGGQSGSSEPSTGNMGSQVGGFFGAIAAHKWWIIGGIVAIIVIFFVVLPAMNGSGNNTANQSPDYSQSGVMPSDISTALDNLNSEISQLFQQQQQSSTGSSSSSGGNGIFCGKGTHWDATLKMCVPGNPPTQGGTGGTSGSPLTVKITQAMVDLPGPVLHDIAAFYGITYMQLYEANKKLLGNDPNHAKWKVGDVLVIPNVSASNNSISSLSTLGTKNVGGLIPNAKKT